MNVLEKPRFSMILVGGDQVYASPTYVYWLDGVQFVWQMIERVLMIEPKD